jgi:hypothetical protein
MAVCEAVKHWRCYLKGCSKFLVVPDHNTQRHQLWQASHMMNKRQTRYLRDLQPYVGTMTTVYRKGTLNEANTPSWRPNFAPHAKVILFWDVEVPFEADLRQNSQPLLNDAQLNFMIVNAWQLSLEFDYHIREKYPQVSFYGDEGAWTKDSLTEARDGYVWRLDRFCVPRNSDLRQILNFKCTTNNHLVT